MCQVKFIILREMEKKEKQAGLPQGCTAPDSVGASGAAVLRMSMNLQRMML